VVAEEHRGIESGAVGVQERIRRHLNANGVRHLDSKSLFLVDARSRSVRQVSEHVRVVGKRLAKIIAGKELERASEDTELFLRLLTHTFRDDFGKRRVRHEKRVLHLFWIILDRVKVRQWLQGERISTLFARRPEDHFRGLAESRSEFAVAKPPVSRFGFGVVERGEVVRTIDDDAGDSSDRGFFDEAIQQNSLSRSSACENDGVLCERGKRWSDRLAISVRAKNFLPDDEDRSIERRRRSLQRGSRCRIDFRGRRYR